MFLSSFAEKYVGKEFIIDCVDIEIKGFSDHQPPIFKGPGQIRGDRSGRLTYKVYNQFPVTNDIFQFLKTIKESDDPKEKNIRLKAIAYDGTKWSGSRSIPEVNLFQAAYLLVTGEFDQLKTRVEKLVGDKKINCTELVFDANFDVPFGGTVKIQHFHGEDVIQTSWWGDHHKLIFEGVPILFQKSFDKVRLHVEACHTKGFEPPFAENWITEALVFSTARVIHPRMVIRHFKDDALVTIKSTPISIQNGMIPPFSSAPDTGEMFWKSFCAYLSKCKSVGEFENLKLTTGFYELCLASKGTLQGLLIPLSLYIEFCVKEIFSSSNNVETMEGEYKRKIEGLLQHVSAWDQDDAIKARAIGLLSNLNNPSIPQLIDILVEQGVLTITHKKVWKKARPFLAHGNIIDFSRQEEFWHYRNYLFSMMYRLIYRIIGYKGLVLDYDGSKFTHIDFNSNDSMEGTNS